MADETRQRILTLIRDGEMNVQELTHSLGLAQSTVSYHLARLHHVDLVSLRREGRRTFYHANQACVAKCNSAILRRISPALNEQPDSSQSE